MRKCLQTFAELTGRTVESVRETDDEMVIITLTGEVYAAIRSDHGYEGERYMPELIELRGASVSEAQSMAAIGIFTHDEYLAWQEKERARRHKWQQEQDAGERRQYLALKAKFG